MIIANAILLGTNRSTVISQLINGLQEDGIWNELDFLHLYARGNVGLEVIALKDVKNGSNGVKVGAPIYGLKGFDFDGVDDAIDTNFVPSAALNYAQDDASFFIWFEDDVFHNTQAGGGTSDDSIATATVRRGIYLNPRNSSNQATFVINDNTPSAVSGFTDSTGLYHLQRIVSTDKTLWYNGVNSGTVAVASTGVSGVSLAVGAVKYTDGFSRFGSRAVSIVGAGSGLSGKELALYNRLLAYRQSVGL